MHRNHFSMTLSFSHDNIGCSTNFVIKKWRSNVLAEFIGIMMGDGTVSPYHIGMTLNRVDDKEYSNTSASSKLCEGMEKILEQNDIRSYISGNNVRIDSKIGVTRYFKRIGSHNPKHLKRMLD